MPEVWTPQIRSGVCSDARIICSQRLESPSPCQGEGFRVRVVSAGFRFVGLGPTTLIPNPSPLREKGFVRCTTPTNSSLCQQ